VLNGSRSPKETNKKISPGAVHAAPGEEVQRPSALKMVTGRTVAHLNLQTPANRQNRRSFCVLN
jgi:hypothetical protein